MGTEVRAVPEKHIYQVLVDGNEAGFASYFVRGSEGEQPEVWVFDSTETDPAYRGQGLAGIVVQAAMDDARRNGVLVQPRCSYVVHWFKKNPDYADLLTPEYNPDSA